MKRLFFICFLALAGIVAAQGPNDLNAGERLTSGSTTGSYLGPVRKEELFGQACQTEKTFDTKLRIYFSEATILCSSFTTV